MKTNIFSRNFFLDIHFGVLRLAYQKQTRCKSDYNNVAETMMLNVANNEMRFRTMCHMSYVCYYDI